nr:Uma2 family endonuclease [Nodosilinea sp. TSF1-S3]
MPQAPRGYATIPPDLMVEVKSPTDSVDALEAKIEEFLAQGTVVGLLVNPDDRAVTVYCLNQSPVVLRDGNRLTVPDVLPGWEVPIAELWSPVFE